MGKIALLLDREDHIDRWRTLVPMRLSRWPESGGRMSGPVSGEQAEDLGAQRGVRGAGYSRNGSTAPSKSLRRASSSSPRL